MKEQMINYLQNMLTRYKKLEAKYCEDDEYTHELFTEGNIRRHNAIINYED